MTLIFSLHHSNIFNRVLIGSCKDCRLTLPKGDLTVPPIPSQGLFSLEVAKKFDSALKPKSNSWWQRLENALQFLYWEPAPSLKQTHFCNVGYLIFSTFDDTFQEIDGQHLSHVSCYTNTFMSKIFFIFFVNNDGIECWLAVVPMTTLKDILDNETVVFSKVQKDQDIFWLTCNVLDMFYFHACQKVLIDKF